MGGIGMTDILANLSGICGDNLFDRIYGFATMKEGGAPFQFGNGRQKIINQMSNNIAVSNPKLVINSIIQGDCVQLMPSIPDQSVDLIITDPPYLVNYRPRCGRAYPNDTDDKWLKPAVKEMYRVLKNDTFCVSFYGWPQAEKFFTAWKEAGFRPIGHLVFVKDYKSNQGYLEYRHEQAILLAKGKPEPRAVLSDVQEWDYTGNYYHPTEKPLKVIRPLIDAYSRRGDVVLDPFCGSGTVGVAAWSAGRRFIGIDLVKEYCNNAKARLNKLIA